MGRDHDFAAAIRERAKRLATATANTLSLPMPDGSPVVTVHDRAELVAMLTLIFQAVLTSPANLLHGEQEVKGGEG